MKNLKYITLSALALAVAPLAHAQTTTVFDSNSTPWTSEANGSVAAPNTLGQAATVGGVTSTTVGGVTTLTTPDTTNGPVNGVFASAAEGTDYFNIPGTGIMSGSGTWTLSTTLSFTSGTTAAGITGNFVTTGFGFGTFTNNIQQLTSEPGFTNQATGPFINDTREVKINGGEFSGGTAAPHSGVGSNPQEGSSFSVTNALADGGDTNIKLQIVLNTNGSEWTEEFLDNGTPESFLINGVATNTISFDPTTITGFAESLSSGATGSSVTFADTTLTQTQAVPEPSSYALALAGIALFLVLKRRSSLRA